MISLPGYQVSELLYESSASWVFRAVRRSDQLQVILKLVKSPQPSPEEHAQMSNEYEIARQMDLPGVIKVLELVDHGLVIEDFGGEALSRLYPNRCLELADFLKLAIDITQALAISMPGMSSTRISILPTWCSTRAPARSRSLISGSQPFYPPKNNFFATPTFWKGPCRISPRNKQAE